MHHSSFHAKLLTSIALACILPAGQALSQSSPDETPEIVAAAAAKAPALAPGPVAASWTSIKQNYTDPEWFRDAKFGIMMHWGLYAIPAHGSEWYVRYMYGNPDFVKWHTEHFGPPDKFGYKDFIPLFTCEKYDPDQWATLFRKSGAKYVIPTAEHHDGFALWDSALTKWDAKDGGPKRDLIGDMGTAVRKQGLKFGVSVHRMNHYEFIKPVAGLATDLADPANDDFYWTANHSPQRYEAFLADWVARSCELIDKYQIDMLWYDMSGNSRRQDPIKTKVMAYYYNRSKEWGKEVAISAKGAAFLEGQVMDYEREGRAPMELTDWVWQADDPIQDKFGYVEGLKPFPAGQFVQKIVENTSKNGNLLLNISPKADGTIPQEQQDVLLEIGKWLSVNGEAIYKTRPWIKYGEGPAADEAAATMAQLRASGFEGRTNGQNVGGARVGGGGLPRAGNTYKPQDIRFTTNGDVLYAIVMAWPTDGQVVITSLANGKAPQGKIDRVELLGHSGALTFTQDAQGLKIGFPDSKPCDFAFALKITGLSLKK